MDYNSTSLNTTFIAGSTSTTVNVPVIKDDIVEGLETFDLTFTIPSSFGEQVIPRIITNAVGNIIDNTSKKIC